MEETLKQRNNDCLKVVLFGPESTGKTTLAKQLAEHFNTLWVPEYMRGYLERKWDEKKMRISKDDLMPIAIGQMDLENKAAENTKEILFCDTNLLELKVYSEYYYNDFCPPEIETHALKNKYALYFLTNIDTPWVFDNLRDRPDDRQKMFRIFESELKDHDLPYVILRGSEKERLDRAINEIQKLQRGRT
jgi:HTH-type transcriptional repressor of NAD biosynthesis genes